MVENKKNITCNVTLGEPTNILLVNEGCSDGNFIPKHRFDEVNQSLKEQKNLVAILKSEKEQLLCKIDTLKNESSDIKSLKNENKLLKELLAVMLQEKNN